MTFSFVQRIGTVLALAVAAGLAAPLAAEAGSLHRDRVHADSFGNLVIYSPAGYKRIIVGMGEAADGYNATGSYYEPETPPAAHRGERDHRRHARRGCGRQPVLLHGRSHMYGLPANVVPVPIGYCR